MHVLPTPNEFIVGIIDMRCDAPCTKRFVHESERISRRADTSDSGSPAADEAKDDQDVGLAADDA